MKDETQLAQGTDVHDDPSMAAKTKINIKQLFGKQRISLYHGFIDHGHSG